MGDDLYDFSNVDVTVDNPGGLIHNYVARKPYKVVAEIIRRFCPPEGVVLDPMFGSGTTIIEASKQCRKSIGIDINPVAYHLLETSLRKWDLPGAFSAIDSFVEDVRRRIQDLYLWNINGKSFVIERCHFDLRSGNLIPTFFWAKEIKKSGKLGGRTKYTADREFVDAYKSIKRVTSSVRNSPLLANSRIAVKPGATVFDYFCNRNLAAIDSIVSVLNSYKSSPFFPILELIVSSAINLIKLSDKKATSQMPFWLPKTFITSRNAFFVLEKKASLFKEGLAYLNEELRINVPSKDISLICGPAQLVDKALLAQKSVDLVLTDPPYTDQVPYLEYSQLSLRLLGWIDGEGTLSSDELVVSDAPERNKTKDDFNAVFAAIIQRCFEALKDNGRFIMFYHTLDLSSWQRIVGDIQRCGGSFEFMAPISSARRSFKTVMSPKANLDGNFLVGFIKARRKNNVIKDCSLEEAENACKRKAKLLLEEWGGSGTTQDFYDKGLLEFVILNGYLEVLASKYDSFGPLLKKWFVKEDGTWR